MVEEALNAPESVADTAPKRRLLSMVIERVVPRRSEKRDATATGVDVYFRLPNVPDSRHTKGGTITSDFGRQLEKHSAQTRNGGVS
jgi:hypothetical protein